MSCNIPEVSADSAHNDYPFQLGPDAHIESVLATRESDATDCLEPNAEALLPIKMYGETFRPGALARPEHEFCPYSAIAKYPYKHLNYRWGEMVSQAFFAHGQFQAWGWTM